MVVKVSRKVKEKEIQLSSKEVVLVDSSFLYPNITPKSREQDTGEEVRKEREVKQER